MHKNIMEFANKVNWNLTTDSIIITCVRTFWHRLERLTGCLTADSVYVICVRRLCHGLETGCLQRVCNTRCATRGECATRGKTLRPKLRALRHGSERLTGCQSAVCNMHKNIMEFANKVNW